MPIATIPYGNATGPTGWAKPEVRRNHGDMSKRRHILSETDKTYAGWRNIRSRKSVTITLWRLLGIASLVAQMQVRISDIAELFADRRGQCARAAAHGKSVGWQRDLPMVRRQHGR